MTAQKLINAIRAAGHEPTSYSGRGMYGRYCIGVSLDHINDADGLPLKGSNTDSLGRGIILYWPAIDAPEDME